eukprot:Em0969g3a
MLTAQVPAALCLVVAALVRCASSGASYLNSQNVYPSYLVGQPCSGAPYGYLPLPCGSSQVLSKVEVPLPRATNGPNLCSVVVTAQVYETLYTYQQTCVDVYKCAKNIYEKECRLQCMPTSKCTSNVRTDTSTQSQCCTGFQPRPPPSLICSATPPPMFSQYVPVPTEPSGCPVAIGCTLYDCLKRQNLTEFLRLVNISDRAASGPNATTLFSLLNSTDSKVTVFAPTNEALASSLQGLVPDPVLAGNIVRNHLVVGVVGDTQLGNQGKFMTVGGATLYSTIVEYYDNSNIIAYSTNPYAGPTRTDRFINGAQIVVKEACYFRIDACPGYPYLANTRQSGQLQIIDSVMMPANETIAQIISNDPRFSILSDALDNLGILDFLNQSYPRTLFVPTDDALIAQLGQRLVDCLTLAVRGPLNNLLLFNLAEGVEYTSSLSHRTYLYTMLLSYTNVYAFPNGTILLGTNKVQITQPNIPASNGVIHIVNGLAIPHPSTLESVNSWFPLPPLQPLLNHQASCPLPHPPPLLFH